MKIDQHMLPTVECPAFSPVQLVYATLAVADFIAGIKGHVRIFFRRVFTQPGKCFTKLLTVVAPDSLKCGVR